MYGLKPVPFSRMPAPQTMKPVLFALKFVHTQQAANQPSIDSISLPATAEAGTL